MDEMLRRETMLTRYINRKIDVVIGKMNEEARTHYGIEGDAFGRHSGYLIAPGLGHSSNREVMKEIQGKYRAEIDEALKLDNPFQKGAAERAVAITIWETNGIFKLIGPNDNAFLLKSGTVSPMYINMRLAPSRPEFMNLVSAFFQIEYEYNTHGADIILGGETAGIPFASQLGKEMNMPTGVVRKAPKGYGAGGSIDGEIRYNDIALLVEDLITDGGSKVEFIETIRKAGGTVCDVFSVFDRLQGGEKKVEEAKAKLHSLTNIDTLIDVGEEMAYRDPDTIAITRTYLDAPYRWGLNYVQENPEFMVSKLNPSDEKTMEKAIKTLTKAYPDIQSDVVAEIDPRLRAEYGKTFEQLVAAVA